MVAPDQKRQRTRRQSSRALGNVAERFGVHMRLAREMRRDGYLRTIAEKPEYEVRFRDRTHDSRQLFTIGAYYGLSREKMVHLYNAGFVELDGLDCEKAVTRYLQRHSGELSVRLLAYVAYSELWPPFVRIKNHAAYDCLSALKVDGKLGPPKDLEPYLDAACRGEEASLERVAQWVRDLVDGTAKPLSWPFFGVRLALIEGHYVLSTRPIPKLRRLRKLGRLRKLLRKHPLLIGCVTPVSTSARNRSFSYVYHRPGAFWDL